MVTDTTELEEAILGALTNAPHHVDAVLALISTEDFTTPFRRRVYDAILAAHSAGQEIDPVTIGDAVDDIATVVDFSQNAPPANNAPAYAEQFARHARTRVARRELQAAMEGLDAGEDDVLERLSSRLDEVTRRRGDSTVAFDTALSRGLLLVEHSRSADDRRAVSFGLDALDERLPQLRGRGLLVVVAARPSVGKTALSNQLSLTTAKNGYPVGKIELEMSIEEMALRSIAAEYMINGSALAAGQDDALDQLTEAVKGRNIRDLPIFLDDSSYSLPEITSRIAEWHRKHGIACVTVDHLHLVAHKGESRNNILGEITRALKLTAKRLKIPIFLMSQLARLNERENRRPKLSDLRDSGAIEQDSDIVIALHSDGLDADENGVRWVDIGILKNRGGRTGWLPRSYAFDGRYQTFTEHPLQSAPGAPGREGEARRGYASAHSHARPGTPRVTGRSQGRVWGSPGSFEGGRD